MKDNLASKRMSAVDVDQHILDIYEFKRRIGKGAYGIVWKAVERKTKEIVAVKKIFDAFKNKTDAQRTYREITFLQAFSHHPNIIKLKALHKANNNLDIYLVFEYMDTDLHNAISQKTVLEDVHKRFVMYQLLKATKFIHSANVVHRDQKPSNILVDRRCRCKVADFGLARSLCRQEDAFDAMDMPLTDYVATRWYRPPEVLVASKRYTQGVDMWSLGCILAEMLMGKALFPGTSTIDQLERILSALPTPSNEDVSAVCGGSGGAGAGLFSRSTPPGTPLSTLLRGCPPDSVDLVARLLVLNPSKRLSAAQALHHPYVRKFKDHSLGYTICRRVIPELSDDFQWSVDEYRTRLYDSLNNQLSSPRVEDGNAEKERTTVRARTLNHQQGKKARSTQGRCSHPTPVPAPVPVPAPATAHAHALAHVPAHANTHAKTHAAVPVHACGPVASAPALTQASRRHSHEHTVKATKAPEVASSIVALPRVDAWQGSGERARGVCRCSTTLRKNASTPNVAMTTTTLKAPSAGSGSAPISRAMPSNGVPSQGPQLVKSSVSHRSLKQQEGCMRVADWINKHKFRPQATSTPRGLAHFGRPHGLDSILPSSLTGLQQAIRR